MASFINNNTHLDSGWTGFYEGSLIHSPRRLFLSLTAILETLFETGSSVENLALLVARFCEDRLLVNVFAISQAILRSSFVNIANVGFDSSPLESRRRVWLLVETHFWI